jgi:hypothetical protein
LTRAFGPRYSVRPGLPVALDDYSEPEPDLAVVLGGAWTSRTRHPAKPFLAMEDRDDVESQGSPSQRPSLRARRHR